MQERPSRSLTRRHLLQSIVVGFLAGNAAACTNTATGLSGSQTTQITAQSESTAPSTAGNGTAPTAPAPTTPTTAAPEVQIVGQGFTQLPPDSIGDSYANEAAVLKWTGTDSLAENVQVTLTLTSASGVVVNSDEESVAVMFPGETVAVSHTGQVAGAADMKVQVSVGQTASYTKTPPEFTTSGVTTTPDSYGFGQKTVGTVSSNAAVELQQTEATAVYYNAAGSIIGGDYTFVNFIPAGGSTSFSIDGLNSIPGIAKTEVFVELSNLTLGALGGG